MSDSKWSAVPAARSSAPLLKVKLWLVLGLLAFLVVLSPLAMIVALTNKPAATPTPVATAPGPTFTSALAQVAALEFLSGQPYTIPVASGVDTSHGAATNPGGTPISLGATNVIFAGTTPGSLAGTSYEIEHFVYSANSKLYHLDVTMIDTDKGGVLGAQPSLFPANMAPTGSVPALNYTNASNTVAAPPNLQSQVNDWATAYAANDSATLAQLANHPGTYAGLGGYTVSGTPTVVSVTSDGSNYIVRVSLLLSSTSAQGYQTETEYDLLVYPGAGLPNIVAWGPPGERPLTPYENLVK